MPLKELSQKITAVYNENEYPTLSYQCKKWETSRPLKGLTVLDATPVYRNTLTKYIPLIMAGAELSVGISDMMPHDPQITEFLRSIGIPVIHAKEARELIFDLILDSAGAFAEAQTKIGYVELTRSGVEKYEHSGKPVFVADNGKIKQIETCLGTGESYFRAMKSLGYDDWNGKTLAVFGSGKVGTGIITYASKLNARTIVITDPTTLNGLARKNAGTIIDFRDTTAIGEAVRQAYAVVTATGIRHALEQNCSAETFMGTSALLANMGVEDEYGNTVPDEKVLCHKSTLNFILEEPTHLKYIETTMSLHNEGAVYLAAQKESSLKNGLLVPPPETEEELLNIVRKNGVIRNELNWIFDELS